jgi:hypothetical protein
MIRLSHSTTHGVAAAPSVEGVRHALQGAIELEHSTIPLYLYALYSLRPGTNQVASKVLHSVVIEEMLHMVLAANVLSALGGRPVVDRPGFVPSYPGGLPGGVEGGLHVHLAPLSHAQLDLFAEVEEPHEALDAEPFPEGQAPGLTIGEFYRSISDALSELGDAAFSPRHQVGPEVLWGSIAVGDVASAQAALELIIEQGEGTSTSPLEAGGRGLAHYYRFSELRHGRHLVADAASPTGYGYVGDEVVFDDDAVIPLARDPRGADLEGELAALNDEANARYRDVLVGVHQLLNGKGDNATFESCLGLMSALEHSAKALIATSEAQGRPTGPSFEMPLR